MLRARKADPNVAMSWTGSADAASYSVHRGSSKSVWPGAVQSGLVSTTAMPLDPASPPSLYFYRVAGAT
jgi:hypothetical protein